jgi:cobalt-zinc-cadmium efflux system membrane fusion protein
VETGCPAREVVLDQRGQATRSRAACALACALVALLTACRSPEPAAAEAADAPPPTAQREPGVHLDEAQQRQITIETVSAHSAGDVIRATGTVEFNADRMARILSPVSGQVQGLHLNVGDDVRQGDTLFVLSSREVAGAVADHLAAQRDLDLSEKTFAMTKDLFEHQAASRIALQQSENDLSKAHAKVAQSEEVLRVLGFDERALRDSDAVPSRMAIRAPIGGTVTERTVTNGQFVGSDSTALMTIADLSTVWVQADIFERDIHSIAAGQKADVTTAAYPADHFSAQVARIGTVVDAQTRTAKMRFVVANPGFRLKPGMFTDATIELPQSNAGLTVPAKAIFVENGRSYAYVQRGTANFARREVDTLAGSGNRVRVTRGLAAGDRVVADGVLLLRAIETGDAPQ